MSNILTLLFALEAGIMPLNQWIQTEPLQYVEQPGYYIQLDAEVVAWDHLFVGGWTETYMHRNEDKFNFDPLQQTYQFRAGVRFDPVEIGWEHICGPHPVHTYPDFEGMERAPFEGAYDKFYIRFEGTY